MLYVCVSQVQGGRLSNERWHFEAGKNPRVVLDNTLRANIYATPCFFCCESLKNSFLFVTFEKISDFCFYKKLLEYEFELIQKFNTEPIDFLFYA